ncbi:MAG: calcium/sodium antiporter [Desulfobacterales bacterium]|jgi:cation:H+ antiporter|nr:calcium/sodium antiporter [Desulfobacterales bacterium]
MGANIAWCLMGFSLLYYGAEWLVKGASNLASSLGIRPVVIGLTVVAFGTSAPELVVSIVAAIEGKSMIAVGNVVGSNICNIALVLGTATVFHPISCHPSILQRDIPIMMGVSVYLLVVTANSVIGRWEGASLFGGVIFYIFYNYVLVKEKVDLGVGDEKTAVILEREEISIVKKRSRQILWILIGIAGVIGGAQIVVNAAVNIMTTLGLSEKLIGLTIVAFGTSLPELATSVVAAVRRQMDISLGNLVGSNVFNILSVIGGAAIFRPILIPGGFLKSGLMMDYFVMMFISFLPWVMMRRTYTLTRVNGLVLLACYAGYLIYLVGRR